MSSIPSSLSDLSPTDASPAMVPDCAELSLRKRRDRLLDVFPAERGRFADPFFKGEEIRNASSLAPQVRPGD
jgi:hypothetical protein